MVRHTGQNYRWPGQWEQRRPKQRGNNNLIIERKVIMRSPEGYYFTPRCFMIAYVFFRKHCFCNFLVPGGVIITPQSTLL